MSRVVIQLNAPQVRPDITHYRICGYKYEVDRPSLNINGFLEVWIARVHSIDNGYHESDGSGIYFKFENTDYDEFRALTLNETVGDGMLKLISNFLISKNLIDGTMEVL